MGGCCGRALIALYGAGFEGCGSTATHKGCSKGAPRLLAWPLVGSTCRRLHAATLARAVFSTITTVCNTLFWGGGFPYIVQGDVLGCGLPDSHEALPRALPSIWRSGWIPRPGRFQRKDHCVGRTKSTDGFGLQNRQPTARLGIHRQCLPSDCRAGPARWTLDCASTGYDALAATLGAGRRSLERGTGTGLARISRYRHGSGESCAFYLACPTPKITAHIRRDCHARHCQSEDSRGRYSCVKLDAKDRSEWLILATRPEKANPAK